MRRRMCGTGETVRNNFRGFETTFVEGKLCFLVEEMMSLINTKQMELWRESTKRVACSL